jgi:hypothetical protein
MRVVQGRLTNENCFVRCGDYRKHFYSGIPIVWHSDYLYRAATASGSLNGIPFTDATVFLLMNNNTTNVTGGPSLFENVGTATVSVGGGPAVTFIDPIVVFSNQPVIAVGFEDTTAALNILDDFSASFATYDLTTSIGPIVGTSVINADHSFATTGGAFVLTSAGDATFTATTTTIPEPSTWAMLLAGFGFLGFVGYRKTRSALA